MSQNYRKKVLYVPCFSGELGWEIINYIPYVNYIVSNGCFDDVVVCTRIGRKSLYPMATIYHEIDLSTKKSSGNRGCNAKKFDKKQIQQLELNGDIILKVVKFAIGTYAYAKHRKFIKYSPNKASIKKWKDIITNKSIVMCVRGRSLTPEKNWTNSKWRKLRDKISQIGYAPVFVGTNESEKLSRSFGCPNLIGKTTMEDLIAIFSLCRLVVGQSTGTMHLASLCGVPHVVWGSDRIGIRYKKTWNPFHTPVIYHKSGIPKHNFACSVNTVKKMVIKMLGC